MAIRAQRAVVPAVVCVLAFTSLLSAGPLEDMKALVDNGDAAGAYRYGKAHPEELGNPAFDFYFGIAAIDSGHAGEGVLALERYTVTFPKNLSARLELARGYYVLGDDQRAREEFNFVLANDPPPAVRANVDRFLTSMRLRESTYRLTAGGFVETGYGYDTNANGGVGSAIITLPGFGVVTVNEDGVHQDTPYRWLAAGGRISKPLAPGFTAIANARMDSKFHSRATQFDQRNASADAGLSYLKNKNLYRAVVSYSQLSVDDDRYRDVGDASIEWLRQINEFAAVQLLAQYGVLRYTGANETRNADVAAIGVGYRKAFIMRWQPQVSVNVLGGRERNAEDRPDLGRRIGGANATLSLAPAPRWTVATIASYQGSRYRAEDALTLTQRKDDYYAINVVTQYAWTRQVILGTELLLARNDSNLDLFQYERGLLTLKVRYEFR